MTLWIAIEYEKVKFFVKAGLKLKEQPKTEKLDNVIRMSLMSNEIEGLTETLVCPNLQTLFLGENRLGVINNDFFMSMPMLRVLDFSHNMELKILPIGIAKLVSLEHLNMSSTKIKELPVELKALENSKYLNLESTNSLEMIPQQLISNFSKLQVLKMMRCACEWSVEEIEHLKDLKVLTISFKTTSMLKKALGSSKFKSCNVEGIELRYLRGPRVLNISGLTNLHHLQSFHLWFCKEVEEVKMEDARIACVVGCFHNLRSICLVKCSKLRNASWVIFAPQLETLTITQCFKLEEIMSDEKLDEVGELNLFSKLRVLQLWYMPQLKTICRNVLLFPQLKKISIRECQMLKKLPLNTNSAKGQEIIIRGTKEWWITLEWEYEATRSAFFPFLNPLMY